MTIPKEIIVDYTVEDAYAKITIDGEDATYATNIHSNGLTKVEDDEVQT